MAFYSIVICLINAVTIGVTGSDVVKAILPISARTYWFAFCLYGTAGADAICQYGGGKGDGRKRIPGKESDRWHPFLAQKAWIEAKKIDREKQQDYS